MRGTALVLTCRMLAAAWLALLAIRVPAAGLAETIEQVKPAVVGIGTFEPTRRPAGEFVGTGFAVADGRHVLTNAHVIPPHIDRERKEYLAVLVPGTREDVREARVVSVDAAHDLALLEVQGVGLPVLRLGDSDHVREGELYAFTGFPIGMVLGMRPVTHRGIVSAITPIAIPRATGEQLTTETIRRLQAPYDVFQLDATAYPGNSGSPLYDPDTGEVIGIVNMVFVKDSKENVLQKPSGISYAIPIRYAEELLRKAGVPVP